VEGYFVDGKKEPDCRVVNQANTKFQVKDLQVGRGIF